ncbi:MAG: hypothetical protein QN732_10220 [Nitrososphaeraceae archaeon]|nr:hypothetical protein [Nitrososphaeraceae archaeon]
MYVIEDPDEKCLIANGIKFSSCLQLSDASVTLPRKGRSIIGNGRK